MIFSFAPNTSLMHLSGMTGSDTVSATGVASFLDSVEFCNCGCEYTEYAFYDSGEEPHKNDFTSILIHKYIFGETWTMSILKDGVVQDTITDSTYGEFFDYGDLAYDYYTGAIVNWGLVADAFGNGMYKLRVTRVFGATTNVIDSHDYRVMPYSAEAADGTVKIESYQNGNFALSDSFRNMRWYQSIRVAGKLMSKTPTFEGEELISSDRQRVQVYDKIVTNYTLELRFIPSNISNQIVYDQMIANELLVSDYNRFAYEVYRRIPVRLVTINQPGYHTRNQRGDFSFVVTNTSEGTIKHY